MTLTREQAISQRAALRVMIPAGGALALSLAGDLTLYAVLPAYASALAFDLAGVGLLLSANRLVRLGSNPLVGWLADRVGRRSLMLTGLLTGALSTLLYALAGNFWVFLLGRLVWGISWSLIYISAICMVIDVTDESNRGWGSGVLQAFYYLGLAVNPLLGGLLSAQLGFIKALQICAGVGALGLAAALLFLPETRRSQTPATRVRQPFALPDLRRLRFERDQVSANLLYLVILFVSDGVLMSTITLFLQQRFGDMIALNGLALPVATAGGAMLTVRATLSGLVAPLSGRWSDRSGRRWLVAAAGASTAAAGCALLALGAAAWMAFAGVALVAVGSAMSVAVLPAIVSIAAGRQGSGLAMGTLNTSGDIGLAVAPMIAYALLAALPIGSLYLLSGGLLAVALGLVAMMRRAAV